MEPAYVAPMNLDEEDPDPLGVPDEEMEDIQEKVREGIQELKVAIYKFKKQFFYDLVSNDQKHNAADMGAMMTYHALFLQTIAYWIGLLDHRPVPEPVFAKGRNRNAFQSLTRSVQDLAQESSDARTLVYSLLFQQSTQHPFDFGENKKNEDD